MQLQDDCITSAMDLFLLVMTNIMFLLGFFKTIHETPVIVVVVIIDFGVFFGLHKSLNLTNYRPRFSPNEN